MLDPFTDEIRRMLADDSDVAATVVLERIRRSGFAGQITIARDFIAKVRPELARAAVFQRTSYLPGRDRAGRLVAHRHQGRCRPRGLA